MRINILKVSVLLVSSSTGIKPYRKINLRLPFVSLLISSTYFLFRLLYHKRLNEIYICTPINN